MYKPQDISVIKFSPNHIKIQSSENTSEKETVNEQVNLAEKGMRNVTKEKIKKSQQNRKSYSDNHKKSEK